MVIVEYAATPLCPAGHLPLRWGDRQDALTSPLPRHMRWPTLRHESISPLVGEMPGRAEGERHTHPTYPSSAQRDLTYAGSTTP